MVGPTILHLENDALVARSISRLLRRAGCCVTTFSRCDELLKWMELAEWPRFDIGVFDIDLDDGHGVDVARALRGRGALTQVCFFSANNSASIRRDASALGSVISKTDGVVRLLTVLGVRPGLALGTALQHTEQAAKRSVA